MMKTKRPEPPFSLRRPPRSPLLLCTLLFLLTWVILAFSVFGCRPLALDPLPGAAHDQPPQDPADSLLPQTDSLYCFCFRIQAAQPVYKLDIFLYHEEGLMLLDTHLVCTQFPIDTLRHFSRSKSDKRIAVIANCPFSFQESAIQRYEILERAEMAFQDEIPGFEVQSAIGLAAVGECPTLRLVPLGGRITLTEVENRMEGYVLMESPHIYLLDVNARAELLRSDGFRPASLLQRPVTLTLPCDVGLFTQYPNLSLRFYPNDSPGHCIGTPATQLVLECEIAGHGCRFPVRLPPLGRNAQLQAHLEVCSETEFHWIIEENMVYLPEYETNIRLPAAHASPPVRGPSAKSPLFQCALDGLVDRNARRIPPGCRNDQSLTRFP